MTDYAKGSLIYTGFVLIISGGILLSRTPGVRESSDWETASACGTARSYREFYANWRTGKHADVALAAWERQSSKEYEGLDWKRPAAVDKFIEDHPEYQKSDIRKRQRDAVVRSGSYEALKAYLDKLPSGEDRNEIERLIDSIVMAEVNLAVKRDDYQELRRLSKKYSDWRWRESKIDAKIASARDNAAKVEWTRLVDSKSEQDLSRFRNKYSGTSYAELAARRITALYDDFDFVKSKRSLKAYVDYVDKHPDSAQSGDAWRCIADELESYVFKRKSLGANEALVRSTLARYKTDRPYSGGLYGTGRGYYHSPLRITTPSYGNEDYFVKLVSRSTGRSVGVYVRAGTTTEVEVPDGTYSIRYATGTQWYGTRFLFGLNARYSRAGQDITFRDGSGYTLTLQKVAHGNLHTSSMSASDF